MVTETNDRDREGGRGREYKWNHRLHGWHGLKRKSTTEIAEKREDKWNHRLHGWHGLKRIGF